MNKLKAIPIGHEDFKELIDDNCYYVDKTLMIKEIIDSCTKVNLYTRPRRFGKTLNMSMLRYYFEKSDEDNSYLFKNLKITEAGDTYKQHMGQYPVISLSLKGMKQPDFKSSFEEYKKILSEEFDRHKHILKSEDLSFLERIQFELICNGTGEYKDYSTAVKLLSSCLYKFYKKKVIILIDEYDVPLENSYFRGFYDEMVDLIRSSFESALKTNNSLEFGILTGCLRVSKESIFTGLNNPKVYSVTSPNYSEYFGFTEDEIKSITDYYELSDRIPEMKEWYDGYLFGKTEIYNPWSILNFILDSTKDCTYYAQPYWSNTSSNDIIRELIFDGDDTTKDTIENLLKGETITKQVYEDITYRNVKINNEYIWSFLLFTGYLKCIRLISKNDMIYAEMAIPNKEIKTIYINTIMQWFDEQIKSSDISDIFEAVISGDTEKFEDKINDWLLTCISYHDGHENYYHGFLAGLLVGKRGYKVKSNRENGKGRTDITICEFQKRSLAVIIEVKAAENYKQLEKKCDEALKQIEDKKYDVEFLYDGYKKIIKYGIAFAESTCRIKKSERIEI